ncbi:MAG TPA: hypothetical protein VFR90_10690 [Methylibium sp.]|uniref:hypothetical protein n=1 Tax=Methylibium sp. TaxID=2067992 RepID=UPI002DB8DF65|nr:hypothetical protein [Methylibium sp.]HEU4459580.1 hypothetical protein [Methylibium sp.]
MTSTTTGAAEPQPGPRELLGAMSSLQTLHQTAQQHCAELIHQRQLLQRLLDKPASERPGAAELAAIAAELDLVRDALFGEQRVGDASFGNIAEGGDATTMARNMLAMVEQVEQRQRAVQERLTDTAARLGACSEAAA